MRASALLVAAGLCASAATSSDARACAELFTREVAESERRPSLAYEQTLIVYDAAKRREHFVREVVFSESREPFGFVVPTPARPGGGQAREEPVCEVARVVRLSQAASRRRVDSPPLKATAPWRCSR